MPVEFDIQDQPRLGFARTVSITWTGIRYRLFRSLMTVLVITVAIAFLMNMLVGSMIRGKVHDFTTANIAEARKAGLWTSRLGSAGSLEDVLRDLAAAEPGDVMWQEMQQFTGLEGEPLTELQQQAREALAAENFLMDLDFGNRRLLAGKGEGLELLDNLAERESLDEFFAQMQNMRGVRFYTEPRVFENFLATWPETRRQIAVVRDKRAAAVERIAHYLGEDTILSRLPRLEGEFLEVIESTGFRVPREDLPEIQEQAANILLSNRIEKSLQQPAIKRQIAGRLNVAGTDVTTGVLWKMLENERDAAWFLGVLEESGVAMPGLTPELAQQLAREKARMQQYTEAERNIGEIGGGIFGLGERMSWLLAISLLVCAVGITNAMLMSVTERYREIATLKCLGALDGSILKIFVLEACLLGCVGAIAGAFLGILLGFLRMLLSFGPIVFGTLPLGQLALGILAVIIVGILLAGLASIYPSLKAAQLAPMEAMRIE